MFCGKADYRYKSFDGSNVFLWAYTTIFNFLVQ